MHHMIEIKTIKIENSYLKKVMRDQNHALVGAAEKNNENAMKTLLAENKKLRQEQRSIKELFGQALKDQVEIHDQNVQLKMKLRQMEEREKDRPSNKFFKTLEAGDMLVRVQEAEAEMLEMRNDIKGKEKQIRQLKQAINGIKNQTNVTRQIIEHETGWVEGLEDNQDTEI